MKGALFFVCLAVQGLAAVVTVGPDPAAYTYTDLGAAMAAAAPGDEILVSPGFYQLGITEIHVGLTLRALGEVVIRGGLRITAVAQPVAIEGFSFCGEDFGVWIEGPAVVRIVACSFRGCAYGVKLEQGKLVLEDSVFDRCGIGATCSGQGEVRRCRFSANRIALTAEQGGALKVVDSWFTGNGYGVSGVYPCRVTGSGNTFLGNALDLDGDVDPELRIALREPLLDLVHYPAEGFSSLQEAVDALVPRGRLILLQPVEESATITKPLEVEPGGLTPVAQAGGSFPGLDLPAFSLVGECAVTIRRLIVDYLSCGPRVDLRLEEVSLEGPRPLCLTGEARLSWEVGAGGLELLGKAYAAVKEVTFHAGVVIGERAQAQLSGCKVLRKEGVPIVLSGLARLEAAGTTFVGGIIVGDWASLVLSHSAVCGPPQTKNLALLELSPFAQVELHWVEIVGGKAGILMSSWGKPQLLLDGVRLQENEIGLALDIWCPKFFGLPGLWLPPLEPRIRVGEGGVEFRDCRVNLCPPCFQPPWPPDLCEEMGLIGEAP